MAKQKKKVAPPMGFVEFSQKYSTEEACREKLYEVRVANGMKCPRCENEQPENAGYVPVQEMPLPNVVDGRHRDGRHAFEAAKVVLGHLFGRHRQAGILGNGADETAPYRLQNRLVFAPAQAMGQREERYTLCGIIEFDDAYFGGTKPGGKRGRGTAKTKGLVAVSKDEAGKPKHLKLLVVPNLKGKTIKKFAEKNFVEGALVETDACRSYRKALEEKFLHEWQVFDADAEMLNWLHTVISNVKAALQGTFHGLDSKYLQRYFDEIAYRFNRRYMERDIFDLLLSAATLSKPITLAELKG